MKSEPKRTSTQPGLGKLDPRRITTREQIAVDGEVRPDTAPPISAATPSKSPVDSRPVPSAPSPPSESPPVSVKKSTRPPIARTDSVAPPPTTTKTTVPPKNTAPPKSAVPKSAPRGGSTLPPKSPRQRNSLSGSPKTRSSNPPKGSLRPGAGSLRPTANAANGADAETGTRRRTLAQSGRSAVAVDHVGGSKRTDAVNLAGRAIPRILKTKAEIAAAPIDHRAGFLLAHIDGATNVQGLVDIAGMPEEDVHAMLEKLRRLGIVAIR